MATTTATVIPQGLALTPDFMMKHDLTPGTSVVVTVGEALSNTSADFRTPEEIDRLIEEICGMFANNGGGMAEELQAMRRAAERRFQEKMVTYVLDASAVLGFLDKEEGRERIVTADFDFAKVL